MAEVEAVMSLAEEADTITAAEEEVEEAIQQLQRPPQTQWQRLAWAELDSTQTLWPNTLSKLDGLIGIL